MTPEQCRFARLALSERLRGLGYSDGMASDMASGKRKPSIDRAALIEKSLNIPAAIWAERVPLQEMWNILKRTSE